MLWNNSTNFSSYNPSARYTLNPEEPMRRPTIQRCCRRLGRTAKFFNKGQIRRLSITSQLLKDQILCCVSAVFKQDTLRRGGLH